MRAGHAARRAADCLRTAYHRAAMLEPERCPFCGISTAERSRAHIERAHPELARADPTVRPRFLGVWG